MVLTQTNIEVVRGDDIRIQAIIKRNGTVVPITGATFILTCRLWLNDLVALIQTTDFELTDAANGEVVITIPSADSEALPDNIELNFDIEMTESTGLKTTVGRGKIKFWADVS